MVEVPPIRVLAVRGYHMTPYGLQTAGESWADSDSLDENVIGLFPRLANRSKAESLPEGYKPAKRAGRQPKPKNHDADANFTSLKDMILEEVRILVATQPTMVSGSPSKTPEIMELRLTGGDVSSQLDWAKERLGQEIEFTDVYSEGQDVDIIGITKGKGFQGSVKRWGVKLLSHKNSKRRRQPETSVISVQDMFVPQSLRLDKLDSITEQNTINVFFVSRLLMKMRLHLLVDS